MERNKGWYILQTAYNCEDCVERDLRKRIETLDLKDYIFDILVPKETIMVEGSDGQLKEKTILLYPSYVFVEMIPTEEVWFKVRNTPKVTGILGGGGKEPMPVSQAEMNQVFARLGMNCISVGDKCKVIDGSLKDQIVEVLSINEDMVNVAINLFGRQIEMDVNIKQLCKI